MEPAPPPAKPVSCPEDRSGVVSPGRAGFAASANTLFTATIAPVTLLPVHPVAIAAVGEAVFRGWSWDQERRPTIPGLERVPA